MRNAYLLTDFYCWTPATDKPVVVEGESPGKALKEFLQGKKVYRVYGEEKSRCDFILRKCFIREKDGKKEILFDNGQRYFFKVKEAEAIDENRAFSLD